MTKDTITPTSRQTLRAELLHLLEDREAAGQATGVKDLVAATEKSETTVRKAVNELLADGFIERMPLATTQLRTVRKQDRTDHSNPKEVNMTDTPTAAAGRGRPADPAVQDRDAKVLALIVKTKEGVTVTEIATALDVDRNAAYLSVWRLSRSGQIVKTPSGDRSPRWAKA